MSAASDPETAIRRACPSWARLQDQQDDGWRIVRPIGRGGQCEIYLCEHASSGARAALKLLLPDLGEGDALKSLLREADLLEDLDYPLIPSFLAQVQIDSQHGILMDFVDGESLRALMARTAKLPALQLLLSASKTIAHLHENNVVHNDIKPENFIMAKEGRLYLVDYGSAKRQSLSNTFFRRLKSADGFQGTLSYCAPELLEGKPPSYASDVWALGIMAHVLFAGSPPYSVGSDDRTALAKAIKAADIPALDRRVKGTDPVLSRIIDRCLQRDPALRHDHAGELVALLRKFRDGRVVSGNSEASGSGASRSQTSRNVVVPRSKQ